MMSLNNDDDSYNENTCVVCFKNVDIFSLGDCDHPVCYECSTRMRVLCRQNECPICRHDMIKVIFTKNVQPYKELDKSIGPRCLFDRKFKIVFEVADIQNAYNKLLAHVCSKCPGRHAFQTFVNLRDHMRREHELFYCDLCVDNLKILTHERRCYTRKELATHRRQGDTDNRSHRGHPLCEFCNERYMDNDELYRHLRRDHLNCHFCDADGLHHYYDSYDVLRKHFRDEHYLCEEGDCYDEKFTSAFRSEIDLKAHRASVHGRHMTKAAAKQARTLELEFTLKPRPRQFDRRGGGGRGSRCHINYSDEEEGAVGGVAVDIHRTSQLSRPAAPIFSTTSNDEFPSLGGVCGGTAPVMQHGLHFPKRGPGRGALTDKDFPALGPDMGPTASVSLRVNSVSVADRTKSGKPTNLSIHVNHRPSGMTATVSSSKTPRSQAKESFPSLLNTYSTISSKNTPQPTPAPLTQWSSKEPESKIPVKPKLIGSVPKPAQLKSKSYKGKNFNDDDDYVMMNDFPALSNNLPSRMLSLASSQWSSGKEPESKLSINKQNPSQPPANPTQPKSFRIEDDFPSLNSRFDASCSFTPEPKRVEPKPPEASKKKESSISISVENDWTKASNEVSIENVSSDSDVGSKKSGKKKKKKSKPKNESASELSQTTSIKSVSNNNDSGKKNKQKEEPKSKAKQIKVEEKLEKTKPNNDEGKKKSSKSRETERKRSELTIDSLNDETSSENNINMKDFPSLTNSRMPPGFGATVREKTPAPPGFDAPSNPPPGFSITLNSVARPSNGLTFTSSSGQNYPIPSGENGGVQRVFSYVSPPNVNKRNASLVSHVTEALRTQAALDEFLQMSALFRQGSVTADVYHSHCREAMDSVAFMKIFPELLVLLPDIEKQQELWRVAERSEWRLSVCAACGQVVMSSDFKHHLATHSLENHFPVLSNGPATHPNAWTNK